MSQVLTIKDVFDLPRPEDIRAMGFVVRLRDAEPEGPEVTQLLEDYVVTPTVATALPAILAEMKQVFARGDEAGRFVHGSFGSGKSHFLTVLSLLLDDAEVAWRKEHEVFSSLRSEHRPWVKKVRPLVVRAHMLSVRGRQTGLDRAIYEAFNQTLRRRGKAPFEYLNVDGVLAEVRREVEQYGKLAWDRMEEAGIVSGPADFEAAASGSRAMREQLARAYLQYKGRDVAAAGIDPDFPEGLHRMARHTREQGFGALVLVIDEFLLWLAEKTGQEFVKEINDLNVIVDHTSGQRAAPVYVLVARQRDIREFFPDLVDESQIQEHLQHHAKRFETTTLNDVELRHIVKGRVLRPKPEMAGELARAVEGLAKAHEKILPALLADGDVEYLKDVYPFHPALIEMLVDVTALMQRERTALRLLYELLVIHQPDLPLGEFLPVGSAFPAIFPPSGVDAMKKVEQLQDIHRQYYQRIVPAMTEMRRLGEGGFDESRYAALDQVVRTVLLAEVSPKLKGTGGLTIERLVQLNSADVAGESYKGRLRVTERDLQLLSQRVADLQLSGTGKISLVRYILGKVSLSDVLARAKARVDSPAQRFPLFFPALKKALGVEGVKGFEPGGPNEGEIRIEWRKTARRGTLKIANVRELPYEAFLPPAESFRILVDYPWDEGNHTVDEDRLRAENARKKHGNRHTVCWLPRHFSQEELATLVSLAAVRFLRSPPGQEDLLATSSPTDRAKLLELAEVYEKNIASQLDTLIAEVYIKQGELKPLVSDLDTSRPYPSVAENLEHVARILMDRLYPAHPVFLAEPRKADLERLANWMTDASDTAVSVGYDEETGKVLRTLGQPLELVNLGQTKATLRLDSRYVKRVLELGDKPSVSWSDVMQELREAYGLPQPVMDLFLVFLCKRNHRALHAVTGEPVEVQIGMPASVPLRLERGEVIGQAEWGRVRELCDAVFGLGQPSAYRTLQAQDRCAADLHTAAIERARALEALHERLVRLEATGARTDEVARARERLAPLLKTVSDSAAILGAFLPRWPDDPADPLRPVVKRATEILEPLGLLHDHARKQLQAAAEHAKHGPEVRGLLQQLHDLLCATEAERPLTRDKIQAWNVDAQNLVMKIIQVDPVGPPEGPPKPPDLPVPPGPPASDVILEETVNLGDRARLDGFVGALKTRLRELGPGRVRVRVTYEKVAKDEKVKK